MAAAFCAGATEAKEGALTGAVDAAQCQRVALRDGETGEPVVGAEDMIVDREAGQVYISAFDRWALEDALDDSATRLPQGGIYAVPADTLRRRPADLLLRRLAGGGKGDFHPHGLALHRGAATARLFAVNHAHERDPSGDWRRRTGIAVFDVTEDGLAARGFRPHPRLCQANNLTALSGRDLLVTRDHGACGRAGRWIENVLGLDRAEVVLVRLEDTADVRVAPLLSDLSFANGIAIAPDGATLAVAETRADSVSFYDLPRLLSGESGALRRRVQLPGSPDNLAWTPHGRVLAAVHPSLMDLGFARLRWFGYRRAGSHVTEIAPVSGETRSLLRDAAGTHLNTATSAVLLGDTVVASGVLDNALLACRLERSRPGLPGSPNGLETDPIRNDR
jgi:hypothetical protein